jgi:hypothetical protein
MHLQRKSLRHLKLVRDYGPTLKMLVKSEQYKFNTVKRILLPLNTSGHIIDCTNGTHWMLAEQGQRYCGTTRTRGKGWSTDLEVVLPELEQTIHTLAHHRCWCPSHRVSSPSHILYFEMTIQRTQIGMFRPIRMDHTNCLQVAIKSIQKKKNCINVRGEVSERVSAQSGQN